MSAAAVDPVTVDTWEAMPDIIPGQRAPVSSAGYVVLTIATAGALRGNHEVVFAARSAADGATSAFVRMKVALEDVRATHPLHPPLHPLSHPPLHRCCTRCTCRCTRNNRNA